MIQLSHIGEALIAEMITRSSDVQNYVAENSQPIKAAGNEIIALPEIKLERCGKYRFDGVHKLDVAILIKKNISCVGLEAKLGHDRLTKAEFEKRFMKDCGTAHKDSSITGSMIAILEGKLPKDCDRGGVVVKHKNDVYSVLSSWLLVVRKRTIDVWESTGRPGLSRNCIVLPFEDIVGRYGGPEPFNTLVRELVSGDYYREWLE